jgi:ATP-dependent DNA helicase RecQ
MRKRPTEAEKALRKALVAESHGRYRWQFQSICAGFILDAFCASVRVAVEADGSSHDGNERKDENRDAVLRDRFQILTLRFSNEEILAAPDRVAGKVLRLCDSRQRFRSWNQGIKKRKG